ncbi:MAG: hypothetical protein ACREAQ_09170 [Nitrososphaera sp.]
MRLPVSGSDDFCGRVNSESEKLQSAYLDAIRPAISAQSFAVMLGDGTVTQVNTFDPQKVRSFYLRLANAMKYEGWSSSEVSSSDTDDLRRLFFQVNRDIGKYHLVAYFGVQFHALPYYRVDKRVIEIQKELSKIADDASVVFRAMSGDADKALYAELQKKGYADLEFQELFEKMFEDEKLVAELDGKAAAVEDQFPQFEEMRRRKSALFAELKDLVIELYQTSPVSIDHNRLMQGEEGVTTYCDIEVIKNRKTMKREAYLDTGSVSAEWTDKVAAALASVVQCLKSSA